MPPPLAVALSLGQTRAAFRPETLDPASRTVEVVWTTGARVRRAGWDGPWMEELSLADDAVDLQRLNSGANLLAGHNAWGLDGIIGVVESAWLEGKPGTGRQGRARVRLSAEQADAPVVRKIQDGLIRHISVGYITHKLEEVDAGNARSKEPPVFRATRWEPVELSLCAVPADAGAHVRSEHEDSWMGPSGPTFPCLVTRRSDMEPTTTSVTERPAAKVKPPRTTRAERPPNEPPPDEGEEDEGETPPAPVPPDEEPAKSPSPYAEQARAEERKRIAGIMQAVRAVAPRLPENFADQFIKDGTPLDAVHRAVFAEMARQQPAVSRSVVTVGTDGLQRLHDGIVCALLKRAAPGGYADILKHVGLADRQAELAEAAREWQGRTLMEIARAYLEQRGARLRAVDRMQLAAYALGLTALPATLVREGPHGFLATSDFPNLLAAVGRAQLTAGYQAAPRTFPPWTRQGTLPDFRPTNRISLGTGPKFLKVQEHGEYMRGALREVAAEQMQLAVYGRILAFTRQAMVNDDVGLFARIPTLFGNSAAAMESDVVYAILTGNPTMADTYALFSTQHANLMTASIIDVKNMAIARAAMMNQKSPDGQFITITPRFLIVGPAQEVYALQFLAPLTIVSAANQNVPTEYRSLQLVVDPRITDNAWYLAADPNQIDTIEYAYLEGAAAGGPFLDTREGWDIDGQEYKAREEFAAKALDYRGLVKNPGLLPP
jgi:hypothetical protein